MNILLSGDFVFTNSKCLLPVTLTRVYAKYLCGTGIATVKCTALKHGARKDLWETCGFCTGRPSYPVLCLRQVMNYWNQAWDLVLI